MEITVYESSLSSLTHDLYATREANHFQLEQISWLTKLRLLQKISEIERGERKVEELFRLMSASAQSQQIKHIQRFFLYSRK